jgi:hypothetical protein
MAAPGVLGNDSDPDGGQLTAILVRDAFRGSITLNPDGSFLYQPFFGLSIPPGYPDTFTYRVSNGKSMSAEATVNLSGYCWQWFCTSGPASDDAFMIAPNSQLVIAAPGVLRGDLYAPVLKAALLSEPTHGKLALNADGGFTYTPDKDFTGQDSFSYASSNGAFSSALATASIIVTPDSRTPQGFNGGVNAIEDSGYAFQPTDFVAANAAGTEPIGMVGIQILDLPYSGSIEDGGSAVAEGQSIPLADIKAGKLRFVPAPNVSSNYFYSYYSIQGLNQLIFRVIDDGGAPGGTHFAPSYNTVTIHTMEINDAPSGTASMVTTQKDTPFLFSASDFRFSDSTDYPANEFLAVKIASLPTVGRLMDKGLPVAVGQIIGKTEMSLGQFQYIPDPSNTGFPITSFAFQVQDDGGKLFGGIDLDASPKLMTINVAAGIYLPSGADLAIQVVQHVAYAFSVTDFGFSTPNGIPPAVMSGVTITTLPSSTAGSLNRVYHVDGNGTYSYNVTAGEVISATDIAAGALQFSASLAKVPLTDFTFQVQDDYGADPSPNTITISSVFVNHPPTGAFGSATTLATLPYTFKLIDFNYNFTDYLDYPSNKLLAVKVTTLPANGSLTDDGVPLVAGQFVTVNDILAGKFLFTPSSDQSSSFTFQVQDDGGTANGGFDLDPNPQTFYLPIVRLNHSPRGTDATLTVLENSTYVLKPKDFGFSDLADSPPDNFQFVVISRLPTAGQLKLNSNPVVEGQYIYVPTELNAGKLKFVPETNASGADYTSFAFKVRDDGGTIGGGINLDPSPKTLTIDLAKANQPPTFFKGDDETATDESGPQSLQAWASKISAGPPNETGQKLSFTLVLDNPVLFLATAQPAINATTGDLTFTPAPNAHGTAHLSVVLKDDGGTAGGGSDTSAPQTFDIVITKPHIWHNTQRALTIDPMQCPPDVVICVYPFGAVALVNYINAFGNVNGGHVPPLGSTIGGYTVGYGQPFGYIDINGDDFVAPNDLVLVINAINAGQAGAEGEPTSAIADQDLWMLLAADVAASGKRRH